MANWLASDSEMSRRIKAHDWASTELGPLASWPQSLRTAVNFMLEARQPVYIAWGKQNLSLYNDGYIPILGDRYKTSLGKPYASVWPEVLDEYGPLLEAVMSGQALYKVDQPIAIANRASYPISWFTFSWTPLRNETGEVAGFICVASETTDKILAERQLIESMNEGFCVLDIIFDEQQQPLDYRFIHTNPSFEQQTGLIDPVGKTTRELVPTLEQKWIDMYARVAVTGQPLHFVEQSVPMGRWFDVYAYRLAGSATRVGLLFRDITSRKRAEEQLQEADRRKDEFLAMLAHELRNPLAPISAAAEILQLSRLDEKRLRHTSEVIRRQVRHMTELVDDLLDVSRVTRGIITLETVPLEIGRIINDAVEQIRPLVSARHHRLRLDMSPETGMVMGDHKRLVQVLANLLHNAARYSPEASTICLRTEVLDDKVHVEVIDNGIGMEPELVSRVFELFAQGKRTSDRTSGGLGLGLALVKSLVESHGGTVSCASEGPGKGSSFTIELPRLTSVDTPAIAPAAGLQTKTAAKPLRIMVVDDNIDAATMLALALETWNHQVIVEHDPQQALVRAETEVPDVFLLDIGLPHWDGYELAKRLRAVPTLARSRLIAVTGYGQDQDRLNAREAGFDHHFIKPVNPTELAALLQDIASTHTL